MLDLKTLLQAPETIEARLALRGKIPEQLPQILGLLKQRRELNVKLEGLNQANAAAKQQMGALAKAGDKAGIEAARENMRKAGDETAAEQAKLKDIEEHMTGLLAHVPNLPNESIPHGGESENRVEREVGDKPRFSFEPKDHHELGETLGILDFERGTKLAQSRFTLLRKAAARMERGLISFMLDLHTSRGYEEVLPPFLVNRAAMTGTERAARRRKPAMRGSSTLAVCIARPTASTVSAIQCRRGSSSVTLSHIRNANVSSAARTASGGASSGRSPAIRAAAEQKRARLTTGIIQTAATP